MADGCCRYCNTRRANGARNAVRWARQDGNGITPWRSRHSGKKRLLIELRTVGGFLVFWQKGRVDFSQFGWHRPTINQFEIMCSIAITHEDTKVKVPTCELMGKDSGIIQGRATPITAG